MDSNYFATKDSQQTASILLSKADSWFNSLVTMGYYDKLRSMYAAYHGAHFQNTADSHQISFSGEEGELVQLPINHIRNLVSHMITMTTANRPVMQARAVNSDYKSTVQTKLANGILDYFMREKRLERFLKTAVEHAVVLGAGFIKLEWNATTGEIYDYLEDEETGQPDPNRPIYEGDIEFSNLSPFDVLFDGTKEQFIHDWLMVRTFKNKYDLAVKYPQFKDQIESLSTKTEMGKYRIGMSNLLLETDDVPVYEFYHKKTNSLPNGRYMLFLTQDIVLQDIGLPYRNIPIYRISSGEILGSPYGYTPMFDILPIQEAINMLYSTILTNQNAAGVQNFWMKAGSDITSTEMVGGLNIISSMEKPESLNLLHTPPEIFNFISTLERVAETISGVNSVARGNPEASLKTGAALALVQSMALQFMSGLQQSYIALIEDIGSAIIKILQDYAKAPRMVAIVGKTNRSELKEFVGEDISNITRVYVDVGNPLASTVAGRLELAQQMMQYQVIKNPNQIIQVLTTGQLDAVTDDVEDELNLIKRENEFLVEGQDTPVTLIDDHHQHILEHRKPLQDPELRKDPELVGRVLRHIQEHINILREGDPQILGLMNQQPLPPQQVPAPPGSPDQSMAVPQVGQVGINQSPTGLPDQQLQGPGIPQGVNLPNVNPNVLPNSSIEPKAQ